MEEEDKETSSSSASDTVTTIQQQQHGSGNNSSFMENEEEDKESAVTTMVAGCSALPTSQSIMEKEEENKEQSSSSANAATVTTKTKPQQHHGSSKASALVISASFKAGMDGIDRERIDAIILRESSNSLFMTHQLRRDEKVNERIRQMKERLQQHNNGKQSISSSWKRRLEQEMEPEVNEILKGRRNRSTCCVIDMDMFFMACELLTRPDYLKEKPCCVGKTMISTSNYKARKYGVRSAMAGWIGDKLVEELSGGTEKLIHFPSNFELYKEKSQIAARVFKEFDPHCSMGSLDEAFVDLAPYMALKLSNTEWTHEQLTQHLTHNNDNKEKDGPAKADLILQQFRPGEFLDAAAETVELLRSRVCKATGGLTCSAGLAPSFTLAKIASDVNKPNGQKIVGEQLEADVWPFLRPLPTRKIPGIGRVTAKILAAFDVDTVQQLWDERALVRFLFKPVSSKFLLRASLGGFGKDSNDDECVDEDCEDTSAKEISTAAIKRKGISRERTFSPMQTWSELMNRLDDIARQLSKDMEQESVYARTISLKIKLQTFDVLQKSRTVDGGTTLQKGEELLTHAAGMLQELKKEVGSKRFSLRLIGIRCSNLVGQNDEWSPLRQQMSKFLSSNQAAVAPRRKLEVMDPDSSTKDGGGEALPSENESGVGNSQVDDKKPLPQAPSNNQHFLGSKTESDVESHTASCPICNKQLHASSQDALNRSVNNHIDACLNAPVIREAVRETNNSMPKRKKQRLTDYFHS